MCVGGCVWRDGWMMHNNIIIIHMCSLAAALIYYNNYDSLHILRSGKVMSRITKPASNYFGSIHY